MIQKKSALQFIFAALLVAGLALFLKGDSSSSETATPELTPAPIVKNEVGSPLVIINGVKIAVELAEDSNSWTRGLSGRPSLQDDRGMLFIFPEPDFYRFWMPDMNFPIDIIWLGDDTIVGITENVSNKLDLEKPVFYSPPKPVKYVLEVNAGFSEKSGFKIGDLAQFKIRNAE